MKYYIASCVFTVKNPELSAKIMDYIERRGDMNVIRCCVPKWKVQEYEGRMPVKDGMQARWCALPETAEFQPGDEGWSLCHNCSNIIEEQHPGVKVHSLWEFIDSDPGFTYPDHTGMKAVIQDCWRSRERADEQAAVRSLLTKMHISYVEAPHNHESTDFCGASLYRPQVARNPKLAPKHYLYGAQGLFQPHTEEEQTAIMRDYCAAYSEKTVICYCHYCLEGLLMGGADGRHIAELLF